MQNEDYEILEPFAPATAEDGFNLNCSDCEVNTHACVDVGCECPIDSDCSCSINELDCAYRIGNR